MAYKHDDFSGSDSDQYSHEDAQCLATGRPVDDECEPEAEVVCSLHSALFCVSCARAAVAAVREPEELTEEQVRREACGCDQCLFGGTCKANDPAELEAGRSEKAPVAA
jgi:hypothetical protein